MAKEVDKKPEQTQTGTQYGYTVEACVEYFVPHRPVIIDQPHHGQIILTENWQKLSFFKVKAGFGVETGEPINELSHTLGHAAAMALAWQLVAKYQDGGILLRVVPKRINYNFSVTDDGEPEIVGYGLGGKEMSELLKMLKKREEEDKKRKE